MKLLDDHPKWNRFIGNLPPDWIDNIPKAERKTQIQAVQNLFSTLTENLYSPKGKNFTGNERFIAEFKKKLEAIIKIKVNFEYLTQKEIGKVFTLKVGDKDYIYKCFHSDLSEFFSNSHGKIMETSRAPYAEKKGGESFVKFYFGKVAKEDTKDGFLVTKFEDIKQKLTPREEIKRLIKFLKSHVNCYDTELHQYIEDDYNMIGRKIIDLGCLEQIPSNLHKEIKKLANKITQFCFNTSKNAPYKYIFKQINDMKTQIEYSSINVDTTKNLKEALQRISVLILKLRKKPKGK